MNDSSAMQAMFADYLSGAISAEHLQVLEAALREDAELRRDFVEYMNLDSALGDLAALSEAEVAEIEKPIELFAEESALTAETEVASASTYRLVVITGSVAASFLIAAFLWFAKSGAVGDLPVATLVADINAELSFDGQPWSDPEMRAGLYRLDRGLLHLRFRGDVMVYVEAPARFHAVSDKRVVLHSGRLAANVPPEGVGFTVETPEAEVIDFGTEFSVDVAAGTSEVHVFAGLVRVKPRASSNGEARDTVELHTSQAIKIAGVSEKPVEIELATDRFIRTFDESRRRYVRTVKRLVPIAYYRMAIRDQGLACVPEQYSGVVLSGAGRRPPHARGVFAGGSLRILADSTGRGGRVDASPPLNTGKFTLTAFVYLETETHNGTVATNIQNQRGNFALALNEQGLLCATLRNSDSNLLTLTSEAPVALQSWLHIVMIVDGKQFCLYEDGRLVASSQCLPLAESKADVLWFGTDADGLSLWNGRIDEVALFDRALNEGEVAELYQAALEEMEKSE